MRRLEVKQFLENYTNDVPIYPSRFPLEVDTGYMFEFTGDTNLEGSLSRAQLTLFSRSDDIAVAEELIYTVKQQIQDKSNFDIGDTHVLRITTIGKHAEYVGIDDNDRYYFSSRFTLLVDNIEQ